VVLGLETLGRVEQPDIEQGASVELLVYVAEEVAPGERLERVTQ